MTILSFLTNLHDGSNHMLQYPLWLQVSYPGYLKYSEMNVFQGIPSMVKKSNPTLELLLLCIFIKSSYTDTLCLI